MRKYPTFDRGYLIFPFHSSFLQTSINRVVSQIYSLLLKIHLLLPVLLMERPPYRESAECIQNCI